MADQSTTKGFSLPVPSQGGQDTTNVPKSPQSNQVELPSISMNVLDGPEPRDYAVAGAVLVVLLIGFFFVRGAYANYLVGKKVSPNSANAAGWWLFVFMSGLALTTVMAILSPVKFMAPLFMAPLGAISVVALILTFLIGRRR